MTWILHKWRRNDAMKMDPSTKLFIENALLLVALHFCLSSIIELFRIGNHLQGGVDYIASTLPDVRHGGTISKSNALVIITTADWRIRRHTQFGLAKQHSCK
jgi:hypothetical protein